MNIEREAAKIASHAKYQAKTMTTEAEKTCERCHQTKPLRSFPRDPRPKADGSFYVYKYCRTCKRGDVDKRECEVCGLKKSLALFENKHTSRCRTCTNRAPIVPNCNPWLLRAW